MYSQCVQTFSWWQLVYGINGTKIPVKAGGLGNLLERGGYQTWVCIDDIRDNVCGDPWFCWVYHEAHQIFTPWGPNGELLLV